MFNKQKPVPEGVMEKILEEFIDKFYPVVKEEVRNKFGGVNQYRKWTDDYNAVVEWIEKTIQKAGKSAVENWCIHWKEGDK